MHLVCTHNKTLATMEFTSNKASVGNSLISVLPLGREERVSAQKLGKISSTYSFNFHSAEYFQISAGRYGWKENVRIDFGHFVGLGVQTTLFQ